MLTKSLVPSLNKYCLFIFIFALNFRFYSQSPTLAWAKGCGGLGDDVAKSIAVDFSGNVFSCGSFSGTAVDFDPGPGTYTLSSAGVSDVFINKLDNSGNFIWAKRIGGGSDERANSLALDASGNVYVTGYFYGTIDFDPGAGTFTMSSAGFADIFILKLDAAGNFAWAKKMGGNKGDFGDDISIDGAGNVYTVGQFAGIGVDFDPGAGTFTLSSTGTNLNNVDVFVSKLNSTGNFVWAKNFGGDSMDISFNIVTDPIGNVYTSGTFYKTPDFDPGPGTYTLSAVGINNTDVFISKLDGLGNFVFAKVFGSNQPDWTSSLALDNSGNIYSTGLFNSTADFDPGPGTFTMATVGGPIYINKLSSTGNFVWAKQLGKNIGGSNLDHDCMTTDVNGDIYIVGGFSGIGVDLDPGLTTYTLTSATNAPDLFVDKISNAGNLIWCVQMGGASTGGVHGNAIAVEPSGNIYAAGDFWATTDFDPSPATYTLSSNFYGDVFELKLNQTLTGITFQNLKNAFQIFPNPSNGDFTINFNEDIELKVINELGQIIETIYLNEINEHNFHLIDLASGIYFLTGQNNHVSVKEKLIVIK